VKKHCLYVLKPFLGNFFFFLNKNKSFFFFFFFFSAGDQTQGLALARQAIFHWAKPQPPKNESLLEKQCKNNELGTHYRLIHVILATQGDRDQEDHDLRLAWANSSKDPIWKICNTKKGWWSGWNYRAPA
jgi:hypothetical protein